MQKRELRLVLPFSHISAVKSGILALLCVFLLASCSPVQSDFPPGVGVLPAIHQPASSSMNHSAHETQALYGTPTVHSPNGSTAPVDRSPAYLAPGYIAPDNSIPSYPDTTFVEPEDQTPLAVMGMDLLGITQEQLTQVENQFGIRLIKVSVLASSDLLNFSLLVKDPVKAAAILNRVEAMPRLTSEKNGASAIPTPRQDIGTSLLLDQIVDLMYADMHRSFRRGDLIAITVGKFKIEHVVLQ